MARIMKRRLFRCILVRLDVDYHEEKAKTYVETFCLAGFGANTFRPIYTRAMETKNVRVK